MKAPTLERIHPKLAIAWLLMCLLLVATLLWKGSHVKIDSNILSLLSSAGEEEDLRINEEAARRIEQQLLWMVSAPGDDGNAAAPALWWYEKLQSLPGLKNISGPIDEAAQKRWGGFLHQYRVQLLDDHSLARLERGADAWAAWELSQIYSPLAGVGAKELEADPLLLTRSTQMSSLSAAASSKFKLEAGWPVSRDEDGRAWHLVRAELDGSTYDTRKIQELSKKLQTLEQEMKERWPGVEILRRGAMFYSNHASIQAEREITLIGSLSLLGIVAIVLFFFRSLRPILLSVVSICMGLLCGLSAVLIFYDSVHVITLVLATSVVGISVDYSLHYLTERMLQGDMETPLDSLRHLFPVLLMAVSTSAAAYMVLLFAPFPGFSQLAVCAIFGLFGAFATVVCWFPRLSHGIKPHKGTPAIVSAVRSWLGLWQKNKWVRRGLPAIFCIITVVGFLATRVNDDVANLQGFPPEFRENDRKIAQLTGEVGDSTWFIVRGRNAEETLRRMEALDPLLEKEHEEGRLGVVRVLSRQIPSIARQGKIYAMLQAAAPRILAQLREADIELTGTAVPPFSPLTPKLWLDGPSSEGWRLIWFAFEDGSAAALVPVSGIAKEFSPESITSKLEGVSWQNRRAEVSYVFGHFRENLGFMLGGAFLVITLIFIIRHGLMTGLRGGFVLLMAVGAGLAVLALSGNAFTLFSMFALILVVGIGVDYVLFFSNPKSIPVTAMLSIFMAAMTTLMGFGALSLSATPAIASFGFVLLGGIGTAFLLAPVVRSARKDADQ